MTRPIASMLALALAACSSASKTTPVGPDQPTPVTTPAAPASGVVVPPGASDAPISIAVTQAASGSPPLAEDVQALSPILAVTPHGAKFSQPVTVRIPFDASRVQPGSPLIVLKAESD